MLVKVLVPEDLRISVCEYCISYGNMGRNPCLARAVKVKNTLLDHESTTAEWAQANSKILVGFGLHHDTQARASSSSHIRKLCRHSFSLGLPCLLAVPSVFCLSLVIFIS